MTALNQSANSECLNSWVFVCGRIGLLVEHLEGSIDFAKLVAERSRSVRIGHSAVSVQCPVLPLAVYHSQARRRTWLKGAQHLILCRSLTLVRAKRTSINVVNL